jgi:cell fate regulator YaaT (PSP1 superfamily)
MSQESRVKHSKICCRRSHQLQGPNVGGEISLKTHKKMCRARILEVFPALYEKKEKEKKLCALCGD